MAGFEPTTTELEYTQLLFSIADPDNLGIITGEAAVPLFARSGLSPDTLEDVWDILDHEKKGSITKDETAAGVRLMGHAQAGRKITEALIAKRALHLSLLSCFANALCTVYSAGPLPTLEGIRPMDESDHRPQTPAASLPPLDSADRSKFLTLFERSGPVNGRLSGSSRLFGR